MASQEDTKKKYQEKIKVFKLSLKPYHSVFEEKYPRCLW